MLDTLFWYTGIAAWIFVFFACITMIAAEVHDRSVQRRRQQLNER